MPLPGGIDNVRRMYRAALNAENRVALAVKFIDVRTGASAISVINYFPKTA